MLLKNKIAIITGAGSGIGRAMALAFAREGASIVVSDISDERGQETVKMIEAASGSAIFQHADTSRPEDSNTLVEKTVNTFGRLDIACNNAGIAGTSTLLANYTDDDWHRIININLNGVFYGMRAEIPAMLANGGGAIVNTSSILGSVSSVNSSAYTAAKHGVVGLTKAASNEYAKNGIRTNAIGPGYIDTPLLLELEQEKRDGLIDLHPIGRLGRAEEVAELAVWLASDRASFVTGAYYPVDGGYLAR